MGLAEAMGAAGDMEVMEAEVAVLVAVAVAVAEVAVAVVVGARVVGVAAADGAGRDSGTAANSAAPSVPSRAVERPAHAMREGLKSDLME
ncbi:hypothetical protein ACFY0R_13750 [Streptomyces sp. NPDC001633]|uniref:hypothetical protein n=1 Tax=Streptomyces sp. NPDC001633 TaxID=3364595 RepID=UPI0036BC0AD2